MHRKTLYELYQIVKEEAKMFENCLLKTGLGGVSVGLKKRSVDQSSSGCQVIRQS